MRATSEKRRHNHVFLYVASTALRASNTRLAYRSKAKATRGTVREKKKKKEKKAKNVAARSMQPYSVILARTSRCAFRKLNRGAQQRFRVG